MKPVYTHTLSSSDPDIRDFSEDYSDIILNNLGIDISMYPATVSYISNEDQVSFTRSLIEYLFPELIGKPTSEFKIGLREITRKGSFVVEIFELVGSFKILRICDGGFECNYFATVEFGPISEFFEKFYNLKLVEV